ncbi:MAG: PTS sugar transporter subunit IIB [Hespellia sp.]|jgi:mannose/fructose/N-acetylgalactosamine-specific phosphotransferase system component IIB|nr:PTS sugar transporter subunit IIB [Hespellia sp.]
MSIILNRLDSRLAHGTVCNTWVPGMGATGIIVVDDVKCKDPFLVKLHEKAAPQGVSMATISTDEMAERFQSNQLENGRIIVLFGDIDTALRAYEKGYTYPELQIANITMPPGKSKKVIVAKGVAMDREEGERLRKLQDEHQVKIFFQCFPPDPRRTLNDVLAKAKFKK